MNTASDFYLTINGEDTGPFTEQKIREMWQNGEIKDDPLCTYEGAPGWKRVSEQFNLLPPEKINWQKYEAQRSTYELYQPLINALVIGIILFVAILNFAGEKAIAILFSLALCGMFGVFLGRHFRNQPQMGGTLGILLGPLGLICIALIEDKRLRCRECLVVVPHGAKKCQHCASPLQK